MAGKSTKGKNGGKAAAKSAPTKGKAAPTKPTKSNGRKGDAPSAGEAAAKPALSVEKGGGAKQLSPEEVTGKVAKHTASKSTVKLLVEQYEEGLKVEDDMLLAYTSKLKENVRLGLLIEAEGGKVPE